MVQGAVGARGRVDRALGVVARRQVTSSSSRGTVSPPRLGEARFYTTAVYSFVTCWVSCLVLAHGHREPPSAWRG